MTRKREPIEVDDSSDLTDADWAQINHLQEVYQTGGKKALSKALGVLAEQDPIQYVVVMHAFFPRMIREAIRDSVAEAGMTEDDMRELIRKLEGSDERQ